MKIMEKKAEETGTPLPKKIEWVCWALLATGTGTGYMLFSSAVALGFFSAGLSGSSTFYSCPGTSESS